MSKVTASAMHPENVELLALSGGGFKALAADAGMFAGVMRYYGIDLAALLKDDLAISANSGSTWFANLLAYSDSFVDSLNDYERLFSTDVNLDEIVVGGDDGFFGVMGEAYDRYLLDYLTGDGLNRQLASLHRQLAGVDSVAGFIAFLNTSPRNIGRFLVALTVDAGTSVLSILDSKLSSVPGYGTLRSTVANLAITKGLEQFKPLIGALTVSLMEGVDWNRFMQQVVFAPDQVDLRMQAINFYSGAGRTNALATQPLVYELAISSDEATVAPRNQNISRDGLVTVSVTNPEAKTNSKVPGVSSVYNFIPATATSLTSFGQRPAPWLPNIGSGDLSVEYDSPAFFDARKRAFDDLNFKGLSAFLASSISSSAGALAQSLGVIKDFDSAMGGFFNAIDLLSPFGAPSPLFASFAQGLAPLIQARMNADGTWTGGDPVYNSSDFSDPLRFTSSGASASAGYLRMADGGYFDNSSVTSGLSYLAANQSSWRSNDGIKDFDITLFVFSGIGETVSETLLNRGFGHIGNVTERLFTGGSPQEIKGLGIDLVDVSHPSSAVFDSTRTSGAFAPIWSYTGDSQATGAASGFGIKAYDIYTTTVGGNNMNIAGGYEGNLRLWNITSPTGAIPLPFGSWDDYNVMYRQIIDALQAKDFNGVAGAELLANQLKIEGTPLSISLSSTSARKNTLSGTVLGVLSTVDPDPSEAFRYSIVNGRGGDDNAFFEIRGAELIAKVNLAYENKTSYSVKVRATDSRGLWTEKVFRIQQPSVQAGPIRGATVFFDARTYDGQMLRENPNLVADAGEQKAVTNGLGQYSFSLDLDPVVFGNRDGLLDWRDGMVIGGSPGADGRISLVDSISGVDLGIPLVGLPGQSLTILSTLKYATLLRWRPDMQIAGQSVTPELITEYFSRIIRNVPVALLDDAYNPYASLFTEQAQERQRALDSLVFAYANLAVVKTVIELFDQLRLDYSSPEALALWGYTPDPSRADRAEIIAFSAYGTAISNRFGSEAGINPADPYGRLPYANQFDIENSTHLRTVLKEILANYPLHDVLERAAVDPDSLKALISGSTAGDAALADQFLEQNFGLLLDKLSVGLKRIVDVAASRLRESASIDEGLIIPSISGSKRTLVQSLASDLVGLAADRSIGSIAAFEQRFLPLFFEPLGVDAPDRSFDYLISLSSGDLSSPVQLKLTQDGSLARQEASLVISLTTPDGQPQAAPDYGLSVRFRLGGTAIEGVDYVLGQELVDRTMWIPAGASTARLPITILTSNSPQAGRTLDVQLLSSDSGFGVNEARSVVRLLLPGEPASMALEQDGDRDAFVPYLLVSEPDQSGFLRLPGRQAGNALLKGRDRQADRFFLSRPGLDTGLPHITNFAPDEGDRLVIDPTSFGASKITDFNTYGGLVFHLPTGTPLALISNQGPAGNDLPWSALSSYAGYFSFASVQPALLLAGSEGELSSAQDQVLLFQSEASSHAPVDITLGSSSLNLKALAPSSGAWTSGLVEQILQSDYDPAGVRRLDGVRQGNAAEAFVAERDRLAISIASQIAGVGDLVTANDVGLPEFTNANGRVSVSRPVVVAVTPQGGENIETTVRMRQNGLDSQAIFFYRVDNLTGMVNGLDPGEEGYRDAVQSRLYAFSNGLTSLEGPGHGIYREGRLTRVSSGDIIAMGLINRAHGHVFYGFAQANEVIGDSPVNHLWSYGNKSNAFGFEDTFGGGDRDYNDIVFSLNFADPLG